MTTMQTDEGSVQRPAKRKPVRYFFASLAGLFGGLWITLRHLFRKPVTVEYPHKKPELTTNFRSAIALVRFEAGEPPMRQSNASVSESMSVPSIHAVVPRYTNEPHAGTHDCVACMQCVQICPSFCITVEGDKPEGLKKKRAKTFLVDYSLCSLCGLCLDVCPTETLTYSRVYDQVGYRRDGFVYDLLKDFRAGEDAFLERARADEAKKAEAKKAAAAAATAAKAAAAKVEQKAPEKAVETPEKEPDKQS